MQTQVTIPLALALRIAGHLVDVLSSDEGVLSLWTSPDNPEQAERDLLELTRAIWEQTGE